MVLKLNMILITSPELVEFRRRLKSLETRVCGGALPFLRCESLTSMISKMARLCSRRYIVHGVTTLLPSSLCVYWPRHTSMLQIYSTSCKFSTYSLLNR